MLTVLLAASTAFAQSTIVRETVIAPVSNVNPLGAGAPTVIYDEINQRFLMLYETASLRSYSYCPDGAYHVKAAWSKNGLDWKRWNRPVIAADSLGTCGARHPAMMQEDNGTIRIFLSGLARDGGTVGMMTTWDGTSDPSLTVKEFIPALDGIEEPTAVRIDGEYHVLGLTDDGLVDATSTDLVSWDVSAPMAITTTWSSSGVFSPSASCLEDPQYSLNLHFGGWNGTESAWGWGVGATSGQMFVSMPFDQWAVANDAWLSFDTIDTGGAVMAYYEYLGSDGLPRIGAASNGAGLPDLAAVIGRDCVTTGP